MNVKRLYVGVSDTRGTDIGIVGENQGRRYRIDRNRRALVVVAYSGDYRRDVIGGRTHVVEYAESHYRAALRMVGTVDDVSDIVQITGDFRELCVTLRIAELQEYVLRGLRDLADVREAVLGEPEGDQRFVLFLDVGVYRLVRLYFFYSYHTQKLLRFQPQFSTSAYVT